jgi:hypothetical protein
MSCRRLAPGYPPAKSPAERRRKNDFVLPPSQENTHFSPQQIGADTMRRNPRLFRLTATVALSALLWDAVLPFAAAQPPAPPPLPAPGGNRPDLNQGDPPERVGRIASMTGAVSFHNLGDTQWSAASPNYPVSSGNAFWTEPSSEAQLEVSDSRIAMAGGTEFDVTTLDAAGLQAVAAQGTVYMHLRDMAPNEAWSLQTPRGMVRLSGAGRYEVVVGTIDQPTLVTVVDGAAQIDGPGVSLQAAANQTATITGTDSFQGNIGPALHDTFLTERLNAERPPPAQAVPIPAQVVAMPGGSELVGTGSWSQAPEYGQVWYPPVPVSWVPYREGHWAYVAPWGWTWIDDASWGFAPFHYGRWIQIGGRWGWTPGQVAVSERPIYAPALVTFIGIGAGVALGAALAAGSIGWVPLGPREQFHPWYPASNNYVRQVNISHVTNINNNVTINNYVNRGAATSIPAAAMTGSRPVQSVARPVTAQELAAARPVTGQQPVRPTLATAGVTPAVARQFNLAPAGAAAMRPAPGPAVLPRAAGAGGFARPGFTPPANTQAAVGTVRPIPGLPGARPAEALTPGPGRPAVISPTPPTRPEQPVLIRPEGGRPAGMPVPEPGRPAPTPQAAPRPGQSGVVRPEAVSAAPHPAQAAPEPAPHPVPQSMARPAPQTAAPLPVVQRPVVQRPTPPAAPAPRPEPQHLGPVAARSEPQHAAPQAPHPEARAAAPAHPEPHERKPGDR